MNIEIWAYASLVARLLLYLSTACVIGGSACRFHWRDWRGTEASRLHAWLLIYIGIAAVLGIAAAVLGFLLLVGEFSDSGFAGMFDMTFLKILLDSSVGQTMAYQAGGFLVVIISVVLFKARISKLKEYTPYPVALIGILLIIFSSSITGHLAESTLTTKIALSLHLLALTWWIGSLLPLWLVNRNWPTADVKTVMKQFGNTAVFIVPILLICGLWLAYALLGNLQRLFSTDYGKGLLFKIVLVVVLLLLAAMNKFYWVRNLEKPGVQRYLSISIGAEMVLGFGILFVTAVLTKIIGIGE